MHPQQLTNPATGCEYMVAEWETLRAASHVALLRAGNNEYLTIFRHFMISEAHLDSFRTAYEMLLGALCPKALPPPTVEPIPVPVIDFHTLIAQHCLEHTLNIASLPLIKHALDIASLPLLKHTLDVASLPLLKHTLDVASLPIVKYALSAVGPPPAKGALSTLNWPLVKCTLRRDLG
ncbi:hypothetical protein NP233_g10503 [Leucocoprinus birnbaumii]|uniref:Uncharacterized protein n=1 Tax=Leucocoprinus birnbaumii TaxID=56174 RepID=A0AAD5VKM4_9AGAR|nr:hypothetical protein NP233_g10503 [Leucocoprinus birnbaumii]